MEDKKFYVYVHKDPRDNSVRYVGKGCGDRAWRLKCRVAKHGSWIASLANKGLMPIIEVLEGFDKEEDALNKEKELIEHFTKINPKLCNMIEAGIGCPSGEKHPMFGTKHSPETRSKMSKSSLGKPKSKKHRENIGLGNKGKKKSPETIANRVEKVNKKVVCIENGVTYKSVKCASTELDVDRSSIVRICRGKQKTSWNKLTFKYA